MFNFKITTSKIINLNEFFEINNLVLAKMVIKFEINFALLQNL